VSPGPIVARVNANGSFDPTFQPKSVPQPIAQFSHAIAVQTNGRVLIALGPELRALDTNGAVDAEFKLGSQPDGLIAQMVILPDGKLLVAGTFKHIGGFDRAGLARLNIDGSVDTTFDPGAGAEILHALVLPGGDYLVGGDFQSYNLAPTKNLAQIRSSMRPRFILWKKPDGLETWFAGNPGARVTVDQSTDFKVWNLFDSRTLDGFATKLDPQFGSGSSFLRAKAE
jgi:hypothetical protein